MRAHRAHAGGPRTAAAASAPWLRRRTRAAVGCGASAGSPCALILEVDGAVSDLHQDGHRCAFNAAFHELGYDCVSWTPQVYHDLLGRGDGTGEGLVAAYYATVGWPSLLPTSEHGLFAAKVHACKREQLRTLLAKRQVPLRSDLAQVIAGALDAGAKVAWISETLSEPGDRVVDCMLGQLDQDVAAAVRVFPASLHAQCDSGADADDADDAGPATLERGMAMAAAELKRRQAASFLNTLSAEPDAGGAGVALAPHLRLGGEAAAGALTAPWLAAVARLLDVPASKCLLVAANASTIAAGATAGMVPVALPRKLAVAGSYPGARAKFEAYGPGYATWPRLAALLPVGVA